MLPFSSLSNFVADNLLFPISSFFIISTSPSKSLLCALYISCYIACWESILAVILAFLKSNAAEDTPPPMKPPKNDIPYLSNTFSKAFNLESLPYKASSPLYNALEKSAKTSSEVSSTASANAPAITEAVPAFSNPVPPYIAALFPKPTLNSPLIIDFPKSKSFYI